MLQRKAAGQGLEILNNCNPSEKELEDQFEAL
jgi:hypothetical protein